MSCRARRRPRPPLGAWPRLCYPALCYEDHLYKQPKGVKRKSGRDTRHENDRGAGLSFACLAPPCSLDLSVGYWAFSVRRPEYRTQRVTLTLCKALAHSQTPPETCLPAAVPPQRRGEGGEPGPSAQSRNTPTKTTTTPSFFRPLRPVLRCPQRYPGMHPVEDRAVSEL